VLDKWLFCFCRGGGFRGGAKANVPFIEVFMNFKIFVQGQSPGEEKIIKEKRSIRTHT